MNKGENDGNVSQKLARWFHLSCHGKELYYESDGEPLETIERRVMRYELEYLKASLTTMWRIDSRNTCRICFLSYEVLAGEGG